MSEPIPVTISVDLGGSADAVDLDEALVDLDRELSEVPDVTVARATTVPPPGAKSGGAIAMTLAGSVVSGTVPYLIRMIHDWTRRRRRPGCSVTVDLGTGITARIDDVDAFETTMARLREAGFPVDT